MLSCNPLQGAVMTPEGCQVAQQFWCAGSGTCMSTARQGAGWLAWDEWGSSPAQIYSLTCSPPAPCKQRTVLSSSTQVWRLLSWCQLRGTLQPWPLTWCPAVVAQPAEAVRSEQSVSFFEFNILPTSITKSLAIPLRSVWSFPFPWCSRFLRQDTDRCSYFVEGDLITVRVSHIHHFQFRAHLELLSVFWVCGVTGLFSLHFPWVCQNDS